MVAVTRGEAMGQGRTTYELVSDNATILRREFNAPAHLVFDAWTQADLVRRWFAPAKLGVSMRSCESDVRVGGGYRYVCERDGEVVCTFHGKYLELSRGARIVYTQLLEPFTEPVIVVITLNEKDGVTTMNSYEVYPSKDVREMAISTGMEEGMRNTMDQFDGVVQSLLKS